MMSRKVRVVVYGIGLTVLIVGGVVLGFYLPREEGEEIVTWVTVVVIDGFFIGLWTLCAIPTDGLNRRFRDPSKPR